MHEKNQADNKQQQNDGLTSRPESLLPLPEALSLEEIMDRVRAEVQRRRIEASITSTVSTEASFQEDGFRRWTTLSAHIANEDPWTLNELLQLDDVDLIETAYQLLLRRPVDATGRANFLTGLRGGLVSKVQVIGAIRFSEEGALQGVHINGLLLPYKLHGWRRKPLIGRFVAAMIWMLRLPRFDMRSQIRETAAASETQRLGEIVNHNLALIEKRFIEVDITRQDVDHLATRLKSLEELRDHVDELMDHVSELRNHEGELRGQVGELRNHEDELRSGLAESHESLRTLGERYRVLDDQIASQHLSVAQLDAAIHENRRSVLDIQRRLMTFLEKATGSSAATVPLDTNHGDDVGLSTILNAQYVSFEDAFRGAREDIKQRAAHYLTTLDSNAVKVDQGLVLDLGCGRGEWLEVLTEHGYLCRGVDLNNVMLEDSAGRGFDVVEADAVFYLRGLDDNSLAAITSMHLVEHLPHEVLIRLLDEALRVLRPGGVLILETPNPENLTVGSYWFYLDPTHRNPIPPPLLQWLVKERGFDHVDVERLAEYRGVSDIESVAEDAPNAKQINQLIGLVTAPPDYAVVAIKQAPNFAQFNSAGELNDA